MVMITSFDKDQNFSLPEIVCMIYTVAVRNVFKTT